MSIFAHFVFRLLDIMRRRSGMIISFGDITPGGVHRIVKDARWSSDSGLVFQKKPEAEVTINLQNDSTATLRGSLEAIVDSCCCRCGTATAFTVKEKFNYIFKVEQDQTHFVEDVECDTDDIETVYIDRPEIHLEEVLREQLFLVIPEKLLCNQECRGVCQGCGAMLNSENCSCDDTRADSPFAVLKQLKK